MVYAIYLCLRDVNPSWLMAVAVAVGVCGEIRGVAGRELWLHLALQKFDTSHLGYLAIQIQ